MKIKLSKKQWDSLGKKSALELYYSDTDAIMNVVKEEPELLKIILEKNPDIATRIIDAGKKMSDPRILTRPEFA